MKTKLHITDSGKIKLENVRLGDIATDGYALWKAAKELQTGEKQISLCELSDREAISDRAFRAHCTGCRYFPLWRGGLKWIGGALWIRHRNYAAITKGEYRMNRFEAERRFAERMKNNYPPGTRIVLLQMGDDPRPIESNTRGTVGVVDDIGTLHCHFDNGRQLGLVPGEDSFRTLTAEELTEEQQMDESQDFDLKLQ